MVGIVEEVVHLLILGFRMMMVCSLPCFFQIELSNIFAHAGNLYQQSLPSPKPLISPYDLPPLFPSFQQQQSSSSSYITNNNYISPSQPSPFDSNSNYESNLGRKRSLSKRIREYSVDLSGDEFNREDDQERVGKRFKDHQDHEDEEESGSEMDVDIAREELSQSKRGTKRAVSDDDEQDEEIDDRRKSRRVLSESPYRSQDEEDDDVSQEEDENASIIISPNRKRRSHPEPNLDKFNSNSEFKKSKSGLRGKPGGKRIIENVSSDEEEEELVGGRRETRNADSEGEEEETNDEINEVKDSRGKSIKKNKSTRALLEDEDEDLMDGAFASSPPPSPPHSSAPSSSNRKRTLSTKIIKKSQSNLGRRTPVKVSSSISSSNLSSGKVERKKGEEWVNLEGDRYKLDKDGVQRRCCEVRETRKKFKMVCSFHDLSLLFFRLSGFLTRDVNRSIFLLRSLKILNIQIEILPTKYVSFSAFLYRCLIMMLISLALSITR